MFNGDISLQDAAAGCITNVGVADGRRRRISATCRSSCCEQNRDRLESVRGVNLDEEAADMLRFEQLYQAAARVMQVADSLFDTLLNTLLR